MCSRCLISHKSLSPRFLCHFCDFDLLTMFDIVVVRAVDTIHAIGAVHAITATPYVRAGSTKYLIRSIHDIPAILDIHSILVIDVVPLSVGKVFRPYGLIYWKNPSKGSTMLSWRFSHNP